MSLDSLSRARNLRSLAPVARNSQELVLLRSRLSLTFLLDLHQRPSKPVLERRQAQPV